MSENLISEVRSDLAVLRTVVESDTPVTETILNGLWRWFIDVELMLPLPVMDLTDAERKRYATEILTEMDALFAHLEERFPSMTEEEQESLHTTDEALATNALWRELAGVFAALINRGVAVLSEEEAAEAHEHAVEMLCATSGMEEDEIRDRIRHDPTMRLMLRRSGIDPDRIR